MIVNYWEGAKRAYHHTAPINMIYGLYQALLNVTTEGLDAAFARHLEAHQQLVAGVEKLGSRNAGEAGMSIAACSIRSRCRPEWMKRRSGAGFLTEHKHRNRRRPGAARRQGLAGRYHGPRGPEGKCRSLPGGNWGDFALTRRAQAPARSLFLNPGWRLGSDGSTPISDFLHDLLPTRPRLVVGLLVRLMVGAGDFGSSPSRMKPWPAPS